MRRPALSRWLMALLPLALLATAAAPAHAQKTTIPESMTAIKRDQAWWTNQLRLGRELGRKALIGLQNAPTDDATPIDESVYQACRDTYVVIRAARYSINEAARGDKFHDPILEFTVRRVEQAWHLSRTAVDKASSGMPRQEYLAVAVRDLAHSMRLIDQILVTLP